MDYDRLRELQEKFDENPRRYFAPLANEYRKGGQPKRAIEICRAHLAQMPGHMSGQIVYGQALFEAGEWDEARKVFERALTLDPENLIALRSMGDMELQAGNTREARSWYARLLDADPKDAAVIALVSEIEESTEAAAAPLPEIPGVDPTRGDQQIPTIAEYEAPAAASAEPQTAESASSATEPASAGAEEPLGLERHYPVESVEDPALTPPPVAETGEAIEAITSSMQDAPGALDSPPAAEPPAAESPAPESAAAAAERAGASAEPFVNETMAQLYLQQGYRQLALKVYRQLSASRPHDRPLKDRIAEIEAADAADHPSEAPMMRREEPSIERPAEPAPPRSPSIESPTPWSQPEPEESPDFDRSPIDSPPPSPGREPSIREFFATLGRRRPPRASGGSGTRSGNARPSDSGPSLNNPAPGASLDSVFAGATVSPSDARAASRLAGAFSGSTGAGSGGARTPPTPPMPTPRVNPRLPHAQESEEDVAKFRAWLDGLTHE